MYPCLWEVPVTLSSALFLSLSCSFASVCRDVLAPPARWAISLRLYQLWFSLLCPWMSTSLGWSYVRQWNETTHGLPSVIFRSLHLIGRYSSTALSTRYIFRLCGSSSLQLIIILLNCHLLYPFCLYLGYETKSVVISCSSSLGR